MSELQCKKSSMKRGTNRNRLHRRGLETLPRHVATVSGKPKLALNWYLQGMFRAKRTASATTIVLKGSTRNCQPVAMRKNKKQKRKRKVYDKFKKEPQINKTFQLKL